MSIFPCIVTTQKFQFFKTERWEPDKHKIWQIYYKEHVLSHTIKHFITCAFETYHFSSAVASAIWKPELH